MLEYTVGEEIEVSSNPVNKDNVPNCNITCRGVRQVQTASAGLEDFADLHVLYLE